MSDMMDPEPHNAPANTQQHAHAPSSTEHINFEIWCKSIGYNTDRQSKIHSDADAEDCEYFSVATRIAWKAWEARSAVETDAEQSLVNSVITYDVVAYNESWGSYGENSSRDGFRSPDEAISYAKSLPSYLNATVWQRTKPNPVAITSIKLYPTVEPTVVEG